MSELSLADPDDAVAEPELPSVAGLYTSVFPVPSSVSSVYRFVFDPCPLVLVDGEPDPLAPSREEDEAECCELLLLVERVEAELEDAERLDEDEEDAEDVAVVLPLDCDWLELLAALLSSPNCFITDCPAVRSFCVPVCVCPGLTRS
ncbi:hypothetical protein [Halosegnis longus]|uniref:hypothetical protein n=1 Tax=Halosegnis longus TaxID=2216012 RepID=UPI00096A8D38|nr:MULTISPECIES: hypothetical protein [Halobacteriales]